ncbi:MAG: hypothetical protein HYS86_03215 [Candidatus Chisholmbacteria bacterium]|nr:hypothetical protein [Candidatus Chisholmbacteria bacterium]
MGWFINNLWNAFTLAKNKEEIRQLLKGLLTHTEVKMLAKRIQIAKMLLEGYDYLSIKETVKVTDPTIARINNRLEENGAGLIRSISHLQKLEASIERKYGPPGLKEKYPQYFALDQVLSQLRENIRQRRKSASAYLASQKDLST